MWDFFTFAVNILSHLMHLLLPKLARDDTGRISTLALFGTDVGRLTFSQVYPCPSVLSPGSYRSRKAVFVCRVQTYVF